MRTRFKEVFVKDLRHIRDKGLLARIQQAVQSVENAGALSEVPHLKKIHGRERYYRIRVGDYRIGLALEDNAVVFIRALHRREIYRYFP
ncbi:MAG: plasmid stabilization protein [Acidobacteria bacterium]|nr:MAG: plasmid stabilization protein [Acidobacteriota bacterium]